ncbi:MAG: hypothetical protein ACTSR3_01080 [Candidatus Helarchaeota archaeon]
MDEQIKILKSIDKTLKEILKIKKTEFKKKEKKYQTIYGIRQREKERSEKNGKNS